MDNSLALHLIALRTTLIRCLMALAIVFIPAFCVAPFCIDFLTNTLLAGFAPEQLHYFHPMEMFMLQAKVAFIIALVVAFPYVAYCIWQFVLPALYENEKRFILSVVFFSTILFAGGVVFCLLVCFPMVIRFGMSYAGGNVLATIGVSLVVSLALWLSLAFGVVFQFPLVTYGLVRFGIVDYSTVCSKRPYVIVGILILSALLTPPDVVSQIILAVPTYFFFELGLFLSKRFPSRSVEGRYDET